MGRQDAQTLWCNVARQFLLSPGIAAFLAFNATKIGFETGDMD